MIGREKWARIARLLRRTIPVFLGWVLLSLASHAYAINENLSIVTGIPGPLNPEKAGLLGFIQNGYLFALAIAGLLAVGSITYGAIQYTISQGNPSKLSDAWDRITQALIGILLLVGAGTILTVVNPGLLSLELPQLAPVSGTPFSADGYEEDLPAPNMPPINIAKTVSCKTDASKCSILKSEGFTCSARFDSGRKSNGCKANMEFIAILDCAAKKVGIQRSDIDITEAYPPSINHIDPRHNNGCSIDLRLSVAYQRGGCDAIKAFASAIVACGGSAANEYARVDKRSGIDFTGCGKNYPSTTGNNIHINACPKGTP